MPRGQYDRAAAKAKRILLLDADASASKPMGTYDAEALTYDERFWEGGKPLPPQPNFLVEELQAKLDAANERIAKYQRLIKQHGLWLDE